MEGLKELLLIPIEVLPCLGTNDMLDVEYGEPILTTCYADQTITKIVDRDGNETISNTTFYLDGAESLTEDDLLTFGGKEHRMKSLTAVRELDGSIALWVVYA